MVRKRLTDLLREEVQKSEEPNDVAEATPDTEAIDLAVDLAVDLAADAAADAADAADAAAVKAASALAEAVATIAHLKTTLAQTQQRETDLAAQTADLQAQLDEQKKLVKSLQADLKRTDTLKKDLEEARKDALQLAEANTKLTQEIAALQKPPSPAVSAIATTTPSVMEARQRQARALSHPVFPNEPLPSQGAGIDPGWMD